MEESVGYSSINQVEYMYIRRQDLQRPNYKRAVIYGLHPVELIGQTYDPYCIRKANVIENGSNPLTINSDFILYFSL